MHVSVSACVCCPGPVIFIFIIIIVVIVVVIVLNVVQAYAHILGLHSHVLRAIPIFVVYLATLMHVYALARQQVRSFASCHALHHQFATSFCFNKTIQVAALVTPPSYTRASVLSCKLFICWWCPGSSPRRHMAFLIRQCMVQNSIA